MISPQERRYAWTLCTKRYSHKKILKEHMSSVHDKGEKEICPVCFRQVTKSNMSRHKAVHQAKIHCPYCGGFVCHGPHPSATSAQDPLPLLWGVCLPRTHPSATSAQDPLPLLWGLYATDRTLRLHQRRCKRAPDI